MMSLKQFSVGVGALLAGLFVLAGCDHHEDKMAHVKTVTASHIVTFQANRKHLAKAEYEALNSFVQSLPVTAVSTVSLEADDTKPRAVARARQLKAYLVKRGIDPKNIRLLPVAGDDVNTIVIDVEYSVGVPPKNCPDWSKDGAGTYNVTNSTNFGCAYYNNFIVQLANPEDFNQAQGQPATSDADRDTGLVQKYRANTSPAAPVSSGAASAPAAR